MEQIVGKNTEKLKALILKVYEYRDKINIILNDVQLLVEDSNQYYISEDGEYWRSQIGKLLLNQQVLINNIKSVGEDLTQVLNVFDKSQENIVDIFREK